MMRRKRGESASPAPVAWKGEEEARGGRGISGRILGSFVMLVRTYSLREWLFGWMGGRDVGLGCKDVLGASQCCR